MTRITFTLSCLLFSLCIGRRVIAFRGATSIGSNVLDPRSFSSKVAAKIIEDQENFLEWKYGGAIMFDAIFKMRDQFGIDHTDVLNARLDRFKTTPSMFGYKLLHDESIPFDKAIGDDIGLFPIAYLNKFLDQKESKNSTDWLIIEKVLNDFILKWPRHLKDGTISRHEGWAGETDKNASFVWADDMFMGLTLAARVAKLNNNDTLSQFIFEQQLQFARHLQDMNNYLFGHGYNDADQKVSCCKWGRANGWAMVSHVEVLETVSKIKPRSWSPQVKELIKILQQQATSLLKIQSPDGRWHQVIDEPSTFLETSCTSMFLSALSRGVVNGWIDDSAAVRKALSQAWSGLQKTLQPNGEITGISMGTGIQTSVEDYEKRPTLYGLSSPGLGSVLYAAIHYDQFLQHQHKKTNRTKL